MAFSPRLHHGRTRPSRRPRLANATATGPRGPLGYSQATRPIGTTVCTNSLALHGSPLSHLSLPWFTAVYATETMSTGSHRALDPLWPRNSRWYGNCIMATPLSPIFAWEQMDIVVVVVAAGKCRPCSGSRPAGRRRASRDDPGCHRNYRWHSVGRSRNRTPTAT